MKVKPPTPVEPDTEESEEEVVVKPEPPTEPEPVTVTSDEEGNSPFVDFLLMKF